MEVKEMKARILTLIKKIKNAPTEKPKQLSKIKEWEMEIERLQDAIFQSKD